MPTSIRILILKVMRPLERRWVTFWGWALLSRPSRKHLPAAAVQIKWLTDQSNSHLTFSIFMAADLYPRDFPGICDYWFLRLSILHSLMSSKILILPVFFMALVTKCCGRNCWLARTASKNDFTFLLTID